MLVTNGVLRHAYTELAHNGGRLGRHLELDARSLAYDVERTLAAAGRSVAIKPISHVPAISILDQGQLGSCTGNAGTYKLSSLSGGFGLADIKFDGLGLTPEDADANERFAQAVYHEATVADGFPGTWEPDDTGSSGLGVCRALKTAGLIDRYEWATSVRGLGILMQASGVLVGMPWLKAFSEPDAHGFIDSSPSWSRSEVVGGHELYWAVLESWDDRNPSRSVVAFPNSWTTGWGDRGWGRIRLSTYVALRQQIDIKSFGLRAA